MDIQIRLKYPRMAAMLERREQRPPEGQIVPKPMRHIPQDWLNNNGGAKVVESSTAVNEVDESLPF